MKQHRFNAVTNGERILIYCETCGLVSFDTGKIDEDNQQLQLKAAEGCSCCEEQSPAGQYLGGVLNSRFTPAPIPGTDVLAQAAEELIAHNSARPKSNGKPKPTKYRDIDDYPVEIDDRVYVPRKENNYWQPEERIFKNSAMYENGFYFYKGNCQARCKELNEASPENINQFI